MIFGGLMTLDHLYFCKNILKTCLSFKMHFQNTNICFLSLWILQVQSAENPQEKTLLLQEKPRGLTACCTRSVQSRHLRKWCNKLVVRIFFSFFFVFARDEQKNKCGGVIVIQYCIFYLIIPMHLINKYMIFTHLLYIFAGTHSNGEIAQ